MGNLYGLIGPVGGAEVALIQIDQRLQERLGDFFQVYEDQFREGVEEVLAFDGGYTPDPHQVQRLPLTGEMQDIVGQILRGPVGRDVYDPRERPPEELRALAWSTDAHGPGRILIQNFTRAQALSRRTMLMFTGETFTQVEEPSLLIGNKIDGVIEGGFLNFKNFNVIKQAFDLFDIYREATDNDIIQFAQIDRIQIADIGDFCNKANKTARKLIFSVYQSGILNNKTADEIQTLARAVDIEIPIENGKIVLTPGRDLTKTLKFLDNSIYRSPVTNERWMANSRRRLT